MRHGNGFVRHETLLWDEKDPDVSKVRVVLRGGREVTIRVDRVRCTWRALFDSGSCSLVLEEIASHITEDTAKADALDHVQSILGAVESQVVQVRPR